MTEMLKGFKNFEEMFRLAKLAKENGLGVSDNTADVMFGDMMGRSKEKERNWLSEDEDNDLLREEIINVAVSRVNSKNMIEPFPAPWIISGKRALY